MGLPGIKFAPKDITPKKFFEEWLLPQAEPFKAFLPMLGELAATLAVRVAGPEGGEWSCRLDKNGLKVAPGLKDDAVITLSLDTKNFLAAVTGELKMGAPQGGSRKAPPPEQIPGRIAQTLESLRQVKGQLRYHLNDPAGDFIVDIKFAGPLKDAPDAEVIMNREIAEGMAKGEVDPQQAFMAGKIRIEGDLSLLIQLMPLMQR